MIRAWRARRAAERATEDSNLDHFRAMNDEFRADVEERTTRLNDVDNEIGHEATASRARDAFGTYLLTPSGYRASFSTPNLRREAVRLAVRSSLNTDWSRRRRM